jgi:hypothetical protein
MFFSNISNLLCRRFIIVSNLLSFVSDFIYFCSKLHKSKIIKMKRVLFSLVFIIAFSLISFSQETVAVLPFSFTDNGHLSLQEGKEAQQYLITYIQKKQKHFKVTPLNARNVNVALNKAGITPENIDNFTIKEISDVVNADYFLLGSIDKSIQGTSSTDGGFANTNTNGKNKTSYGVSSGTTTNKYHATVYISIFKSDGTPVFDKNKGNVFIDDTPDSWKNSILWLVRHFPFYK